MMETTIVSSKSFRGDFSWYHLWWVLLSWGLLLVIIGMLFLMKPGITTRAFVTSLGAFWLVLGIFFLVGLTVDRTNWGWKTVLAVLNVIAGIVVLLYPIVSTDLLLKFLLIFVGVWACFIVCAYIYLTIIIKDAGYRILGIISIVFGLLLFPYESIAFAPFVSWIFSTAFLYPCRRAFAQVKRGFLSVIKVRKIGFWK